ncbi:tetratricopeptide (TPR) repeat protein [Rhodococcus sp. LBL1]|nr:tetratricopeptide (TPR) repeat protein [Rhodococcus sp. LBL1]MDH6681233.1 tetratricopeptide (TPR) repeat protein [Rhodococcus sp. LBL2]
MPNETTVDALISEIDSTPYGPAERELIERAIMLAEETGDEAAAYAVRMRQIQSASITGDTDTLLTAFAWCVGRNAADPATFPTQVDDHDLLWFHKWIADSLSSNPLFPRTTIAESIEQMETAYRQAGVGVSGVVQTRFWQAFEGGRMEEAARHLEELGRTPRDEYSHCEACVRSEEAQFRFATGDLDGGLALVEEMLDQDMGCADEPERAMAHTLVPLLQVGRLEDAERMHVRGYRLARGNVDNIDMIGQHLILLAVTGNAQRALEMLERHIAWLAHDKLNATAHLDALTAFAVTCTVAGAAGLGHERVRGADAAPLRTFLGAHDGPWTVDELAQAGWRAAEELAARFDERNGTTYRSEKIAAARVLAGQRWDLPIGAAHTVAVPSPAAVDPVAAAAFVDEVAGMRPAEEEVDAILDTEDGDAARAWVESELSAATEPGRRAVLLRLLAQLLASAGRFEDALTAVDGALDLAVTHMARSLTAPLAALSAQICDDLGRLDDAAGRLRLATREAELAGAESVGHRYRLGVTLVRAGHPDEAMDELSTVAETEEAQGEEAGSRAMTMLWLGYARRDAGEPGAAVMAWTEGHELAQAGADFALAARIGKELGLLMMQFDDEDALEVLDDAVEDARQLTDQPEALADLLHARGRARCQFDDETGLEDLRAAAENADPWTRADIEDSTARALSQLGRFDEAVRTGLAASDAYAAAEDVVGSGNALIVVAQALLTTERHEEALAVLADAAPRVTAAPQLVVRVALMEGDAYEALGRHDAAAAARARVDG